MMSSYTLQFQKWGRSGARAGVPERDRHEMSIAVYKCTHASTIFPAFAVLEPVMESNTVYKYEIFSFQNTRQIQWTPSG